MYRVSYNRFMELLSKAGCGYAISQIKEKKVSDIVTAIEVGFTIDDKDTPDEVLTIDEFYIYTKNNTVLFGIPNKYEHDFIIEWARTQPSPSSKYLAPEIVILPNVNEETKTNLEFLQTRALDACEYADTQEEKLTQYAEVDNAYMIVSIFLKNTTNRLNHARGRLGDLSRMIEKTFGDAEDVEEINDRIDEIYKIITGNKDEKKE